MHELDCVMKEVVELEEVANMLRVNSPRGASISVETCSNRVVVGVDEDLMELKERLTGMSREVEIIPIVGMGGIGKTTLARKLYEDSLIVDHFRIRAWATISQEFNMRPILLSLLHCVTNGEELDPYIGNDELIIMLHRSLFARRYMIVLDGMWSVEAWDGIRLVFPDNNNGSRIVITTRLSNVAENVYSHSQQHKVHLLSEDQSWNLLRQIVFGEEECPYGLERIGKKIASDCRGLPLAINVVGGILSKAERSTYAWENIRKDIGAIVESVDQMIYDGEAEGEGMRFTFCTPDLQQVTHELDCVMKQVVELEEVAKKSGVNSSSGASLLVETSSNRVVVGVDEDLLKLKDRLTGDSIKLEIIPIVGMGGIGKTTLARKLYEDSLIVDHFRIRAWATISQDFNMRAILLSLLYCVTNGKELDQHIGNDELIVMLHKLLIGRRYMIVLDDMWSVEAWDEIRRVFPNNNNGSRIVITTRLFNVAKYADSRSQQHEVQLLSEEESWNLLRQIVFGEDECPYVLERIGRKIANDCRGLPLAINVVGGLLSKAERSTYAWKNIGKDIGAIVESDYQFSNILSLSYNHLPNYLKPCFLYMGAFPEDYEIKASRLMRMWVAEGFLRPNGDQSLEEVAEDCLKSLTDRNLIMVTAYKYNRKPKRYTVHDLLRDLCMRKADEEKFLYIKNAPLEVTISNSRRVSVHTSYDMEDVYASTHSISLARSFLCTGLMSHGILSPLFFTLRLLRVLDVMEMRFQKFPKEIFQLVNLRYLAVFCYSSLPSGISRLRNLQTLIASFGWGDLPYEIWEMPELRHLKLNQVIWVDDAYTKLFVVQKKLQKISFVMVTPSLLRNGFFESIPNIKDLGIYCDVLLSTVVDLSHLHRLVTLRCQSSRRHLLPCLKFPSILRKLMLVDCVIFPEFLTTLSALPNLEVLNIKRCVFESESTCHEWEAAEGDVFRSLKVLSLERLDLVHWIADEYNFRRLEHLLLVCCYKLEEIPGGFAEIPTLKLLELYECSRSAEASARRILEEQSELGNDDIQLFII